LSKFLAIDYGSRKVGIAISDLSKTLAREYTCIRHNDNINEVIGQIKKIVIDEEIERIILGLPLNMDGTHGFQADEVVVFQNQLAALAIPIVLVDERRSSVQAQNNLRLIKVKKRKIADHEDARAAMNFLQDYLSRPIPIT